MVRHQRRDRISPSENPQLTPPSCFRFASDSDAIADSPGIQEDANPDGLRRNLVKPVVRPYDSPVTVHPVDAPAVRKSDFDPAGPWLLLIHQIPRTPDYFRVKIGRRLDRIGAVAIKNSIYVLPFSQDAVEDFQWVLREIADGGGEASICRAAFVDGLTDTEIQQRLRDARAGDYEEITRAARTVLRRLQAGREVSEERRSRAEMDLARVRKRLDAVSRIDFFDASSTSAALSLVRAIEDRLKPRDSATASRSLSASRRSEVQHRVWVTREGIFVDRIASAWLIRRFIDPNARFKFVAPQGYRPQPGELRFDMFEAEYTHEGDRCTFETLLRRFQLDDPALAEIAEVVHDIDLRDGKFAREEARGIERVLAGIAAAHSDDTSRLERGAALFDDLYALAAKELARAAALLDPTS